MSTRSLTLSLVTLSTLIFGGWYLYNQEQVNHTPVVLSQSGTSVVSDLANPFGSGGSSTGIIDEIKDATGTTKKPEIIYNTTWKPRTLSGVYYQFGVGNPKETDKSMGELKDISINCLQNLSGECQNIPYYESLYSTYNESMDIIFTGTISRMTPEIEYLVYSFLSNLLIRQSSEKCGEYFWRDGQEGAPFYNNELMHEDMGEVSPENWWKPYRIDIHQLIVINPSAGRKELNIDPIWTLRTQILFPALTKGQTGYYTNTKLTECLAKNNILAPLQAHVDRHYRELMWLWREYKVEE